MSAKEMFEELDYEYENLHGVIRYTKMMENMFNK